MSPRGDPLRIGGPWSVVMERRSPSIQDPRNAARVPVADPDFARIAVAAIASTTSWRRPSSVEIRRHRLPESRNRPGRSCRRGCSIGALDHHPAIRGGTSSTRRNRWWTARRRTGLSRWPPRPCPIDPVPGHNGECAASPCACPEPVDFSGAASRFVPRHFVPCRATRFRRAPAAQRGPACFRLCGPVARSTGLRCFRPDEQAGFGAGHHRAVGRAGGSGRSARCPGRSGR